MAHDKPDLLCQAGVRAPARLLVFEKHRNNIQEHLNQIEQHLAAQQQAVSAHAVSDSHATAQK
jgi:hypothetical protein